jgi:hypothetical protein
MTWDKITAILHRENVSCDAIDYTKTVYEFDEGLELHAMYLFIALAFDAGVKHANERLANATADSRG